MGAHRIGTFATAGVAAILLLVVGYTAVFVAPHAAASGTVRTYYIAADPVLWNYTPSGMNEITGEAFGVGNASELDYTTRDATMIGTTYMKCLYQQYTDASFATRLARPAADAYLGLLGPVIYAVVGDTVNVTFQNHCDFDASIVPQGLAYDSSSQGTGYNGSAPSEANAVPPGGTWQYTWSVPASAAPTVAAGADMAGMGNDAPAASSTMWLYQSGTNVGNGTDTGLVGPIIVTAAGAANADGTPTGVDANIVVLFNVFDETNSAYLAYNIAHFALDPSAVDPSDQDWIESNNKYSMNGYLYGNMPMIEVTHGQHVRWYIGAMGADMHMAHWHGNTVIAYGMKTDIVMVLPGTIFTADMWPDDDGIWLFHCHVDDHLSGGMISRYQVLP